MQNNTPVIAMRIAPELIHRAKVALGNPALRNTDLVVEALSRIAGVNPSDYALKPGRKMPQQNLEKQLHTDSE